jgi:redox-sensitive bicupin YhaK (pirin superfamily)
MLIITFVYSIDSMGNTEVMRRGDLQMTSAGTGIRHSEKCHDPKQVHFLQIWASPNESNLSPKYYTRFAFSSPQSFSLRHRPTKPRTSVYSGISPMKTRRTNGHIWSPRLSRTAKRSSTIVEERNASSPAPHSSRRPRRHPLSDRFPLPHR